MRPGAQKTTEKEKCVCSGEEGLAMDFTPQKSSQLAPGYSRRPGSAPTGASLRGARPLGSRNHAGPTRPSPGHWDPGAPEAGLLGGGGGPLGEDPRGRTDHQLTPPRSLGRASGTSPPPRRGLPGAGCRRPAPLPPRGPSLLRAEGPPHANARGASRRKLRLCARRCRSCHPAPSSQTWRSAGFSRQIYSKGAASLSAPPTERGFRARRRNLEKDCVLSVRLRSVVGSGEIWLPEEVQRSDLWLFFQMFFKPLHWY